MAHGEINHIEFPADDPERAMRFYEAVAGWEFSAMDGMVLSSSRTSRPISRMRIRDSIEFRVGNPRSTSSRSST